MTARARTSYSSSAWGLALQPPVPVKLFWAWRAALAPTRREPLDGQLEEKVWLAGPRTIPNICQATSATRKIFAVRRWFTLSVPRQLRENEVLYVYYITGASNDELLIQVQAYALLVHIQYPHTSRSLIFYRRDLLMTICNTNPLPQPPFHRRRKAFRPDRHALEWHTPCML